MQSRRNQGGVVLQGAIWVCLACALPAHGQTAPPAQAPAPQLPAPPSSRLLTAGEGRSIVRAAWQLEPTEPETEDCSHLVHVAYQNAGFDYPYQSSFDLYTGTSDFARVMHPRTGDLIVWPGHVGIVVNPVQHTFYSRVSTGLEEQAYDSPYWKSRGLPRFYRFRVQNGAILRVAQQPVGPRRPATGKTLSVDTVPASTGRSVAAASPLSPSPAKPAFQRDFALDQRGATNELPEPSSLPVVAASIIVSTSLGPPSRDQLAQSISGWSDTAANLLRDNDPLKMERPIVIVDQFRVKRVKIKGDSGSAQLEVESKVSIAEGAMQCKRRQEKALWQLRRTDSGWVALPPPDKTFVSRDAAAKNLAARLAQLTQSDAAAAHDPAVLQQESQLAQLLNTLLAAK